jgi:formylmethanofuran dehydrogenase subunit A
LLPVNTNTAANTFTNFLDTQGSSLTPAQQETLAAQVNSLGLGGEADLSFYSLPGDLGAATGYLQLAQGLQSGDNLVIANGLNVISDGALDSAMKHAIGNIAAGTHAGEAANDDEMREVA